MTLISFHFCHFRSINCRWWGSDNFHLINSHRRSWGLQHCYVPQSLPIFFYFIYFQTDNAFYPGTLEIKVPFICLVHIALYFKMLQFQNIENSTDFLILLKNNYQNGKSVISVFFFSET